jgi:proline iminopeptidase
MPDLLARDGIRLAYQVLGEGTPVVCLAGGPMLDSEYLGDLGGLSEHVQLILFDYRGTGRSEMPTEALTYRCDHLVDDVEALREHLGLDQMNLLAHSAGANLAALYTARHQERICRLLLITPGTFAFGFTSTSEMRREVVKLRWSEPWFADASTAFERIQAGEAMDSDWEAITPFTYGRWDAETQAHDANMNLHRNNEAAAMFGAEGAYDPPSTRAALAGLRAPVLLLAGEIDVAATPRAVAELAEIFANSALVTQPDAGHFPWLDDPAWFTMTVAAFLD